MPIFVTGGSGYIGKSVIRELRRRSHVVHALARNAAAEDAVARAGAEPVRGDLRNLDVLRRAAAAADGVVYLAQEQSEEGVEVGRAAVGAILEGLRDAKTIVYTSGVWVYGWRGDTIVGEDAPLDPLPIVAWRPAIEDLVLSQQRRVRAIVVRPGIVYGDGGGIPGMMVQQARDGDLKVVGDGTNRWPTVRHDALAELYALALESRTAMGVYNATRGAAVPYIEIAHAASRAAGRDGRVVHVTLRDAQTTLGSFAEALACDLQVDSSRATRELGWEPHRPTLLEELSNTTVV